MAIVMVNSPGFSYGINIRGGLVPIAGATIRSLSSAGRAAVVTDSSVASHYLTPLTASLEASGFEVIPVLIPGGEAGKSLDTVSLIYDRLLSRRVDRNTPLIALGGGIVGDVAGFAAATLLRGVPFIQMPTTLLAMVDASVGGKTGVNHAVGKNMIGAFYQPTVVLADVATLTTLPDRELRAGLAECIKHDIIRDAEGFNRLEQSIERALNRDADYLTQLVAHNVNIKVRVVEADPYEHGERAHLNFGHTFGHAFEKVTDFRLLHGECVSLGMMAASNLARDLGMLSGAAVARIKAVLQRAGLPVSGLDVSTDEVVAAMRSDKKVANDRIRLIVPDRIGHVVTRQDIPDAAIRTAIESLR
jgi:3-dehydroquinate synthase